MEKYAALRREMLFIHETCRGLLETEPLDCCAVELVVQGLALVAPAQRRAIIRRAFDELAQESPYSEDFID